MTPGESAMKRRDFIRIGSLSLLGITLSQYLELRHLMARTGVNIENRAKAQACILLFLEGGPSHIDTWDPKPTSGFRAISTNVAGIQISELLPQTAKQMDKLAVIRSMHTEEIDHPEAIHYLITGHRQNPAMRFPSLGSIISKETTPRNEIPRYVTVPRLGLQMFRDHFSGAFLGPEYNPMEVPDPSQEFFRVPDLSLPESLSTQRIEERRSFLKLVDESYRSKREIAEFSNMDSFSQQAMSMILSPAVQKAFDLSKEAEKTKEAYGRSASGQSVLLARRLVEAGCRFVTAGGYRSGNWDTHADNDRHLRERLVPPLDQSLSALLQDLDQRGLLETTIVLAMGEFGRTPHINPDNGRDHWPHCWSLVIGGGGIQGGQVVGSSDEKGAYVEDEIVTMGDLFATIYKAFGIDWTKSYMTRIGRPIKIANSISDETGSPIDQLI